MDIDNQSHYASFRTPAFSFTSQSCSQAGCMEALPVGRTRSMCDRCQIRLRSSVKRQKTRHDTSVTVKPATPSVLPAHSGVKMTPREWNANDADRFPTPLANAPRYHYLPPPQSNAGRHSDLPSSYPKTHSVPPHCPPKRQPRVPGAVLLSQAPYTYMPARIAAPHFNSRGELIPLKDHISASISRDSARELSPCTRCGVVLLPGHLSNVCTFCHTELYTRPPQSSSMAQVPFSVPSQTCKQPIEQGNTPPLGLRSSVGAETPRHDASTTYPVCVPPLILKCSAEHVKPVLDTNSDVLDDAPTDRGIDVSAELSYTKPTEPPPSTNQSRENREPTDSHLSGLQEIQGHPPIQPNKPNLSIRIPPRQYSYKQMQSSSDTGTTMTSQALEAPSNRICNSRGCDRELKPDAVSLHCFPCVIQTWRKKNTKGLISARSSTRKSVSWADEVGGDLECVGRRLDYGKSPDCVLPSPPSSEPLESPDDMDVEGHRVIEGPSPTDPTPLSRDAGLSPRLTQTPEPIIAEEALPAKDDKAFHLSDSDPPPDHNPLSPNGIPPSTSDPSSDNPAVTSEKHIFGWDSDLSEISDPSIDEGESEEDSSDSEPIPQPSGLKIRIPPRRRLADSDIQKCTIRHCQAPLSPDYRWKCCVTCRTHYRQYQRNRLGIRGKRPEDYFASLNRDYIPCSTTHLPSPPLTPSPTDTLPKMVSGARVCAMRGCGHILPSATEYPWNLCEPCRGKKHRKTKVPASADTEYDIALPILNSDQTRGGESEGIPPAVTLVAPKLENQLISRCSSSDCGVLLDPTLSRLECNQCAHRKLLLSRKTREQSRRSHTPVKPSPYPQYKCLSALLSEFKSRFVDFLEAHSHYLLSKVARGIEQPGNTTIFKFDGEFSVVTLDFDILSKREEVVRNMLKLKEEIELLCGLQFGEDKMSTHEGGFVRRFACRHEVPSTPAVQSSDIKTHVKTMQGELEVAVIADHSHRLFAGQRTVVRFCWLKIAFD